MKLKVPDWKSAWFDQHISDRFFQEMAKLEKGPVGGLETSAHWMEQVMIDVGQLAQAMIRLENRETPDPQIRQAFDKALRLSALSLHLTTALEELARMHTGSWSTGALAPVEEKGRDLRPLAFMPGNRPSHGATAGGETSPHGADLANPSRFDHERQDALSRNGGVSPTVNRVTSLPPTQHKVVPIRPAQREKPVDEFTDEDFKASDRFSSLVDVSNSGGVREPSQMRLTIQNLAHQGLSRAEIEIITGEPRHIIEAVLDHRNNA